MQFSAFTALTAAHCSRLQAGLLTCATWWLLVHTAASAGISWIK